MALNGGVPVWLDIGSAWRDGQEAKKGWQLLEGDAGSLCAAESTYSAECNRPAVAGRAARERDAALSRAVRWGLWEAAKGGTRNGM